MSNNAASQAGGAGGVGATATLPIEGEVVETTLPPRDPPTLVRRGPRAHRATTDLYLQGAAPGSLTALEQAIGGRQKLVAALLHAPAKDDLAYVIGAISDPQQDDTPLAAICAAHGITVGEVLTAYREGVMAASQVRAIHHIAEGLPAVVHDVMARAQPYWETCKRCQGTGSCTPEPTKKQPDPQPGPCDACDARGQYVVYPDLARQEFAAELGGMLPKKGGGPLIDMSDRRSINLSEGAAVGGMAQLVGAVDALLYKRRPGTPIEAPTADPVAEDDPAAATLPHTPQESVAYVVTATAATDHLAAAGLAHGGPSGPLPPPGRRPRGDGD